MKYSGLIFAVLLTVLVGAAFIVVQEKDTQAITVNVTLARPSDDDAAKIISQVDANITYVKRMEIREETPLFLPGITIMVIQDLEEKSGWNSIPIPESGIYGRYSMTIELSDTIDKSKPVRILARVLGPDGKEISVKAIDVMVS